MTMTSEQIKGKIKNLAVKNKADARVLLRIYVMERFLERISVSDYKDTFIIKGGILVTSMLGVSLRSTMDIDTTIKNYNVSAEDVKILFYKISQIDLNDNTTFEIKDVSNIMDNMEYPGIRVSMQATLDKMIVPIKIDVSTGDVVTPREITYDYPLMLENRTIKLWSYNLETILAEKIQTVLARGTLNTRMRDFYDIHVLLMVYSDNLNIDTYNAAFKATCSKRKTEKILEKSDDILKSIEQDDNLLKLWNSYQRKYAYAKDIEFQSIIESIKKLIQFLLF